MFLIWFNFTIRCEICLYGIEVCGVMVRIRIWNSNNTLYEVPISTGLGQIKAVTENILEVVYENI